MLANRKEILEGIDRSLDTNRAPIVYSQGRTNSFTRVKHVSSGRFEQKRYRANGTRQSEASHPLFGDPFVPAFAQGRPPFAIASYGGITAKPSRAEVNNFAAAKFFSIDPYKNAAGVGETVAELLTGNIPKLVSNLYKSLKRGSFFEVLRKAPKRASQDYLNAQFGLGPILSDLHTILVEGIILHDSMYGQSYRRRRSSALFREVSTTPVTVPGAGGGFIRNPQEKVQQLVYGTGTYQSSVPCEIVQEYDLRFTARFTLARASDQANGWYDRALMLVRNYGLWTPSLLWDLAPWSWMIDWFLNISRGFTLAYDYGKDGGVLADYGCVTSRTLITVTTPGHRRTYSSSGSINYDRSTGCVRRTDTLVRVPVNPFGTTLDLSALSGWQVSILTALGLARTRG